MRDSRLWNYAVTVERETCCLAGWPKALTSPEEPPLGLHHEFRQEVPGQDRDEPGEALSGRKDGQSGTRGEKHDFV